MITNQPTQLTFAQLFDAFPDAVVHFRALYDESGRVIDFVVDYANANAQRYIEERYQAAVGKALRHGTQRDPTLAERTFMGLRAVAETGEAAEHEYFSTTLNEWLLVSRAKSGSGVLSIIRITTARKQIETALNQQTQQLHQQNELLAGVLETSLSNVFVYEAIRAQTPDGQPGPIEDFTIRLVNSSARRDTIAWLGVDPRGNTLLNTNPDSRSTGQFELYCRVTETGQAVQTEQFYPTAQVWFNTSVTKLGDGCVVTGIDITAQKRTALTSERQTELTEGVLDGSSSGIKALEPIRDQGGAIDDFTILVINAAGATIRGLAIGDLVGKRVTDTFPGLRESGLFDEYVAVIQSGRRRHLQAQYNNAWYDMTITPFSDGLVVTYTDISESRRAKLMVEQIAAENLRQANFLNSVLDGTSNGVVTERAVRDAGGTIIDFIIVSANRRAAEIVQSTVQDLVGYSDLELHPNLRQSGLFDAYVTTVETGEPQFIETYYNDGRLDHWINVSTRKLGSDELVITFANVSEAKRNQRALEQSITQNRQQAEMLNRVLDGSINGVMSFEAMRDQAGLITDFRIMTANQASERIVGTPQETMIGNTLLTLFPGNVDSGLFDLYAHTTQTGEPGRTEIYYNHDGLDFWLDISAQQLSDGFVVTFTDTSLVKRAAQAVEQAAAASERQADLLNTVLDNSQTAISLHEAIRNAAGSIVDFRTVLANSRSKTMWGPLAEAIMTQRFFAVATPEQQANDFEKYVSVIETGEPDLTEFSLGEQRLLRLTAKSGDGVVISNIDITEIHRLQQRLEASAAELQSVIDTAQTGIFLLTPVHDSFGHVIDFRFRVANRMLAAYVGQEPAAVVGALGSTWFPGYKTNGLFDAYYKTYITGERQRFDFHYDDDGIDVWLDIMSTKLDDEVLVTFGDYTPLKKLQQQLEASVIDLQRSNANLEQFAYVASHDLQEPLRKIQAFGDIIQTKYAPLLDAQGADLIKRMQVAANRMQMLIKDVLAYSRVATRQENVGPVDLNEVIKDVRDALETAISAKQALVAVEPLPTITGDAPQLRQLIQNLLSNALKFVKPGTKPHITLTSRVVRGCDAGMAVATPDVNRLFHLIELQDNGIGFEPHHAERIFQVFQRLHSHSSYEGTGIGLAIVHKVVDNHQGYIEAQGQPDAGATFRILLPVTG